MANYQPPTAINQAPPVTRLSSPLQAPALALTISTSNCHHSSGTSNFEFDITEAHALMFAFNALLKNDVTYAQRAKDMYVGGWGGLGWAAGWGQGDLTLKPGRCLYKYAHDSAVNIHISLQEQPPLFGLLVY